MRYRWIEDIGEFRDISAEWDRALLRSGTDNPFLLSDFISAWWKYYSRNLKLRVVVFYEDKEIIGGLPLCLDKIGHLEYLGGWAANYTEFLAVDNNKPKIWKLLFEALNDRKDWRLLRLKRYRKNTLCFDISKLTELNRHKNLLLDTFVSGCTYLIDIPRNFEDYPNRLPKKLRYYLRRSEKEFSKLGRISLSSLRHRNFNSSGDDIGGLADRYIDFSKVSFKSRNKQSAFEDSAYCGFFKELMDRMHRRGYLDANVLKLDNRIIAMHFGYSIGNNLNYIFPAFDIEFAQLNPGHLLIYRLVELGSKRKNDIFDFYTGYQFYKGQWSNRKEEIVSVEIRPADIRGRFERVMASKVRNSGIVRRFDKAIRSSPILLNAGRNIKALARRFK